MLSQTADYALRAALFLAANPQHRLTTGQIAAGTGIPPGYLSKVLQALVRARLVHSQPGVGGGFVLADAPAAVTLLAVVEAVCPLLHPTGPARPGRVACPLHRRLDELAAHLIDRLGQQSLGDLLAETTAPSACCHFVLPTAIEQPPLW